MALQLRIGIATGPVIAGVVGTRKFIYDLWGDTVNVASRIAADATPGSTQVDSTTWKRLRQKFHFYPPVRIDLKGKGDTMLYPLGEAISRPARTISGTHQS